MTLTGQNQRKDMLALLALSFAGFAASFTGHLIAANLGTYMSTFGTSMTMIGLVVGSLAVAEIIFKTPFGIAADRYGRLKIMVGGFLMLIVVSLLYPVFHDPVALLAIRFMQGIAIAAFSTTSSAMVADLFAERKGEAIGTYNSLKGAGYALGPMLGGFVIQYRGFGDMFMVCAVAGVVALILTLLFVRESYNPREHKQRSVTQMLTDGSRVDFMLCYLIGMSGMLVFYAIITFLQTYGSDNGFDTSTVGLIIGIQAVVYVLAQYYSGRFADRYGSRLPLLIGSAFLTIGLLIIALFPSIPAWIAAVVLTGIGIAALWVVSNSYLAYAASPALMGTVMGLSGMFKEVGDGGGPILVGLLGDALGLKTAFLCCLVFTVGSFIMALFLKDTGAKEKVEVKVPAAHPQVKK